MKMSKKTEPKDMQDEILCEESQYERVKQGDKVVAKCLMCKEIRTNLTHKQLFGYKTMGVQCVISSCRTTYKTTNDASPNKKRISYYVFPKDERLRKIWATKCGKSTNFNNEQSYVCSKHFKDDDFEPDLRSDLLDLPIKRKLKPLAIPSLKLNEEDGDQNQEDNQRDEPAKEAVRKKRYDQRERKKYIEEVLIKKRKPLKRPAEVNSTSLQDNEQKPIILKKKKEPEEKDQEALNDIDAAELQKLLNIIRERIQCLEQESDGLNHIMEDIKGRIEKLENRH